MIPTTLPHGRTARRLEWQFLPRTCAPPSPSGAVPRWWRPRPRTPGSRRGSPPSSPEDGSRHFVKAASVKAQRTVADAYREEARKLGALPAGAPAPRLLWTHEDDWVVLGLEYVESRQPRRPWRVEDLDACLDMLTAMAEALTPAPRS